MANEFKVKKGLIVDGSNTVLDIQGTQGQLFSVTDSLTGSLFSVSDVSGVPILNVNSSGLTTIDGNLTVDNIKMPTVGGQIRIGSFTSGTSNDGEYANDDIVVGDGSISIYPHRRGDYGLNESTATSTTFRSKLNIWSDNEDHITFGGASTHMVSAWESWKIWINNDSGSAGTLHLYNKTTKTEFAKFSGDGTSSFINGKFLVNGELESTSLDVNGNADISGTLDVTGVVTAEGQDIWHTGNVYTAGTSNIVSSASANTPSTSADILFDDSGGCNKVSLNTFYGLLHPFSTSGLTIDSSGSTDNYYITCQESGTQRLTIYENSNNIWINSGSDIGFRPRLLGGTGNMNLYGGSSFIVHKSQTPYDETTQGQGIGAIHLDPNNATAHAGASITWGASDSPTDAGSNAQAGIYVRSDGSYGTKMYFATTDSYATGSKTAIKIDHSGNVTVTRGNFYLGNVDTGTDNTVLILNGSTLEVEKRENVFAVSAGAGIHGGATSGTATINLDIDGTNNYINMNNTYTPTTSDLIPFSDVSDGTGNGDNNVVRKATIGTILGLASASTPSNMVTTNTTQTISGTKTFSSVPYFNNSSVNARFSYTAGSQGIQIEDSSTTRQTFRCDSSYLRFWMGGSSGSNETLTIAKTGRVGINDGTPDYTLDVYGNVSNISIYASHDIAAYSDARVKDEIETIPNALDKVNKLRGVTFVRTDEGSTDKRMMGVIAQEVKDILPEVVNERESDGHYSVSYGNMVGVLIEAIKELKAEVEELKGVDKCKCKN